MFEELFGLPAHPLIVHAAVVVLPLLAMSAVGYALVPAMRNRLEPVVIALAVAGPLAAGVARESGEAFRRRLARNGAIPHKMVEQLDNHAELAQMLLISTVALAATTIAFVQLARLLSHLGDPAAASPADITGSQGSPARTHSRYRRLQPAVARVLVGGIIALAGTTAYYVFLTGHSGASMVWTGM